MKTTDPYPLSRLTFGLFLLSCLWLTGCGGSHAEYDPKSPWIGTRATFGPPMAYITNLPSGYSDREEIRLGRVLTTLERAEDDKQYIRIMHGVVITPVPAGTTFEVIAVFKRVQGGYMRMFAHDYDIAVLKDSHGRTSTMLLSEFPGYVKEQTGGPMGGLKSGSNTKNYFSAVSGKRS